MPTLNVNGESIAYERAGSGSALVLLHSLGTASWLWWEQIRRWESRYDVIAFDVRGHGSSSNNGGVTLGHIAEDTVAVLDALGIRRAQLVGISMGGLICARINELKPGLAAALAIADTFATLGAAGPKRIEQLEQQLAERSLAQYAGTYTDRTLLPETLHLHGESLQQSIAGMKKETYLQTARSVFLEDATRRWAAVRVPTLVVVGDKDSRTPPAAAREIASLVPDAQLRTIPNAAHLSNLDNPAGFHEAIDPFLAVGER